VSIGLYTNRGCPFTGGASCWSVISSDIKPNQYLTFNLNLDFPPHYSRSADGSVKLSTESTGPPPITDDALAASNRERIPPPRRAWDFLPDLMVQTEEGGYQPRTDLKPLHVVQPEGVSFKMNGHVLEWQNWKMHVGKYLSTSKLRSMLLSVFFFFSLAFTHREGIALSTITYNDHGEVRPIFYRLSLAEMLVPYGAPESPHSRKFAFDS
jgi:primary-amine oxidase